jgi:hypothetical protein
MRRVAVFINLNHLAQTSRSFIWLPSLASRGHSPEFLNSNVRKIAHVIPACRAN